MVAQFLVLDFLLGPAVHHVDDEAAHEKGKAGVEQPRVENRDGGGHGSRADPHVDAGFGGRN